MVDDPIFIVIDIAAVVVMAWSRKLPRLEHRG
jgi:hypothetical protein